MTTARGVLRLLPLALALGACAQAGPAAAPVPAAGPAPAAGAGAGAAAGAGAGAAAGAGAGAGTGAGAGAGAAAGAGARRATLRFDIAGRPFPSPLVDVLVGGQPASMIVDTGATHHVVAAWLVEELGLPVSSAGDVGVDHAGQRVRLTRLEGAELAIAGWGRVDAPALLVVAVPEPMRRAGIGGVVSPQALAAGGRDVVLDLRAGAMTEAPAGAAAEAGGAALGACGGGAAGRELTAAATVAGQRVALKVDTGASNSALLAGSPHGKQLAARANGTRSGYAASGKHTVAVLPGLRLQLGAFDEALDLDLLPGAPREACPVDGYVGMDVLRSCVLVLGEARAAARCDGKAR